MGYNLPLDPDNLAISNQTFTFALHGAAPTGGAVSSFVVNILSLRESWTIAMGDMELGKTNFSAASCTAQAEQIFTVTQIAIMAAVSSDQIVSTAQRAAHADAIPPLCTTNTMDLTLSSPAPCRAGTNCGGRV